MAGVNIELNLSGGEREGYRRWYQPGSTVQGWVRLTPDGSVNSNRVIACLEWHTEGRGSRDHGRVDQVEIVQGAFSNSVAQSFSLTLPPLPWSYAGHYINIIWQVLVVVDIPFARDIRREEAIIVAPRRTR
jgi:hypothetical protein